MSAAAVRPLDVGARELERRLVELEPIARGLGRRYFLPGLDRDDVEQLARVGIWEALQLWDGRENPGGLAAVCAERRILDEVKRANREKRRGDREAVRVVRLDDGELVAVHELVADPISVEQLAEARAELRAATAALATLSELERRHLARAVRGEAYASRLAGRDKRAENAVDRGRAKVRRAVTATTAA